MLCYVLRASDTVHLLGRMDAFGPLPEYIPCPCEPQSVRHVPQNVGSRQGPVESQVRVHQLLHVQSLQLSVTSTRRLLVVLIHEGHSQSVGARAFTVSTSEVLRIHDTSG